jgi:hypothetical protein
MEFEKLFQVLVVSGGVMVGGCATKVPTPATEAPQATKAEKPKLDCEAICDVANEGRSSICPDSTIGGQNCCWLMLDPHECCP